MTIERKKVEFNETPGVEEVFRVAVYGSLRSGLHNYLGMGMDEEIYLGDFDTPPLYSLYAVSSSYPGLKVNGTTSIKMEVYEVTQEKLEQLNSLEGWYGPQSRTNLYNRTTIDTPWGDAYLYTYNHSVDQKDLIETGDWKDYFQTKEKMRKLTNS